MLRMAATFVEDAHLVELETGDFQNGEIVGFHFVHIIDERVADVSADK